MTNKEWLDYLAQNVPDELAAWFDAKRVTNQAEMLHMPESHESATMQHIRQVIEDTVKRGVYGDTEPENADSRELILSDLEKKTREWHDYDGNYMRIYSDVAYAQMKELLDRQAAITERESLASRLDSYELATMIDTTIKERNELEAKLAEMRELLSQAHIDWLDDVGEYEEIIDKLKSDLNTAVCDNNSLRYELECLEENKTKVWCDCDCCKWQEEREKLTAERDELKFDISLVRKNRDKYRSKFGKCLDYADAIHALMDDEGMA